MIDDKKLIKLIKEICLIPSPSGYEIEKANFIKNWLQKRGAINAFIDNANNVIFQYGKKDKPKIVFMAHIDTVFPLEIILNFVEDDEMLRCPSVGDNSANVAGLMLSIKYLIQNKISFENYSVVFVFSAGEEGLGNLAGCRYFMENNYNIKEVIAIDGSYNLINDNAVGSHRYNISVKTKGGHSFMAFGNDNAIHIISKVITELYNIEIPKKENTTTTYNVGTINGGTSVNSIAQSVNILYEYRSDNYECLCYMKEKFDEIIKKYRKQGYIIDVELVGERPCAKDVNPSDLENLICRIERETEKILGEKTKRKSGSMDCNIPLSMGIPSSSIGIYIGINCHSKEEELYKKTLNIGMKMLLNLILSYQ